MSRAVRDWNCTSCQHLNFKWRDSCQRCGDTRPGFGFNTGPDVRPGDWYCTVPNCGAHNYASRSACFKCGAIKDRSSSSSSSSSGAPMGDIVGWKSGDWICPRSGCNKHNFASRMECYSCNAPRDFSSTEK